MPISPNPIKIFLFLLCSCVSLSLKAQQQIPQSLFDSSLFTKPVSNTCNNDKMLYQSRKDADFRAREAKMNLDIRNAPDTATDTIYLPVVVHIINPNPFSITDAQIINGINLLNDAFSKSGIYSASPGADTKIRFCLAKKDPDGGNSTGITRTTSFFSNHLNKDIEDTRLKNLIQWDPSRYINIWLVTNIDDEAYADFICGSWYRLGVGGYATMPPGSGSADGIVITGFGALLAHEMGHYLGLYHTFEGSCTNNNCLVDGDHVCDTPPDGTVRPSAGCGSPTNSCNTDTLSAHSNGNFITDVPDQIANFMDYGNGACSIEFTQGQADRMRAAVATQRTGLLMNECTPPCADNITANFTRNISYPVSGNLITFTNSSAGASNFQWLVNDSIVSTAVNFSYTFNTAGKNKVTLKAFNTPGCFAAYSDYVITTCGVTARFYTDKQAIASKAGILSDSIVFTNTSYNAATFQWLISNDQGMAQQVVSTNTNLTYVFPVPGNYSIRLIATSASCSDTTEAYNVPVSDPTADATPFNVSLFCFMPDKVRINFCIADFGYAQLPANTPVNFYDADPRIAGANKLSPSFYLPSAVPGGNCFVCFTHTLNVAYMGLEKIYIVVNDSGTVIPIALPNTPLAEKNYLNNIAISQTVKTTVSSTICQGQNYAGHILSGTYIDTLASRINGCDSIRTLFLTVNPVKFTTVDTAICQGQNYAGHLTSGTYTDIYKTTLGCDSTRTLHLIVKPTVNTNITDTICQDENYAGHTTSGIYIDVYAAVNGCDSTRTLNLTVKPKSFTTINAIICSGESYLAGGHLQTTTGVYADTLLNYLGCDSVITTNLTVNPLPSPDLGKDRGVCIGDVLILEPGNFATYLWQDGSTNNTYTTNIVGKYYVLVTNNFGCQASDTIKILRIDTLPVNFLPLDTSLCRGNVVHIFLPGYRNYSWSTGSNGASIDIIRSGTYILQAINRNGCKGTDSIKVFYYNCPTVWIPNAFTPDADALNNVFKPIFPAPVSNYRFQIWDRWGLKVFESKNSAIGWDGKFKSAIQPSAVYVYIITFTDIDGMDIKKTGTVTLLK